MSTQPYNYKNRNAIHPISWNDFHGLCKSLAQAVAPFQPQLILAVGRGGFYPGTLIAHLLQAEIYPIRLSRRVKDIVQYTSPQWMVEPPAMVKGQRILVVDEICDSGQTLSVIKEKAEKMGAASVKRAVLYAHSWGADIPDYVGLITDALILNPWDREILKDGEFQFHPEYVEALTHQGIQATSSLLIDAQVCKIAKGPSG